ncbi:MAG: glycosyltransferase family 39 protein [Ferruginibacter sp.]
MIILFMQKAPLWGDEIRHMSEVQNLLNGYYSPPYPKIELRNGPGYPLFMLPFIALNIPLVFIKLMNAVFLYLSIVFLYKALLRVVSTRVALLFGLFWGCYYNSLDFIALLYAETMSSFLVAATVLLLIKAFEPGGSKNSRKYLYLAGFVIGFLALTKIIFGYVILCMFIGCGILWLLKRTSVNYRKGLIVLIIAFATVTPYLAYTYHLTGRIFYWGSSGGDNLYWMSTPYEKEYGSWFPGTMLYADSVKESPHRDHTVNNTSTTEYVKGSEDSIRAHHLENYKKAYHYIGVERDDVFKDLVYKNIKAHPVKYLQNIISNIGRILFNYPYSYTAQKPGTLARIPMNGTIVLLSLFCLIPTFLNWKRVIYPIQFLLFFGLLYLGGSVFGSAEIRMFAVIVPALLLWIAFTMQRTVKINLGFKTNHG